MEGYKQMVEESFPNNCAEVVEMVQQLSLAPDIEKQEETVKNFVVDIYDLQVAQQRIAGAFIKKVSSLSLYQGEKFVKFIPSGLAWVGGYGKMELISNVNIDNPLLKNGIWFVCSEEKGRVIPIYPVRQADNQYEELQADQLQDLLKQIFI